MAHSTTRFLGWAVAAVLALTLVAISFPDVPPQLIAHGKYVRPALGAEMDERLNQPMAQWTGTSVWSSCESSRVLPPKPRAFEG